MVDAVPSPEYDDYEYRDWLQRHFSKLEDEARKEYYHNHGLMIWNVTESPEAAYPLRPTWKKILGIDREFGSSDEHSMDYLTRVIKKGVPIIEESHLYLKYWKISLDFAIADLVTETIERKNQEMSLTILSLVYQGWLESASILSGQIYRGPDILQFPESLIRWEDSITEMYQEKSRK